MVASIHEMETEAAALVRLVMKAVTSGDMEDVARLDAFAGTAQCTSALICRSRILATWGGSPQLGRAWSVFDSLLSVQLTKEHVAAQAKMATAAEDLQAAALKIARASWGIAFASFVVTAAALYVAVVK